MKTIFNHNGQAHQDEIIADAMLIYKATTENQVVQIRREIPTEKDFENQDYIFVDVGGKHETPRFFDHHQMSTVESAISLVAKYLNLDSMLKEKHWYVRLVMVDQKGPAYYEKAMNLPPKVGELFGSPIIGAVRTEFQAKTVINSNDWIYSLLNSIGEQIFHECETLPEEVKKQITITKYNGTTLVYAPNVSFDAKTDDYIKALKIEDYLSVTKDIRSGGLKLYRTEGLSTLYDFTKLGDNVEESKKLGVLFAHKSGFLATITGEADSPQLMHRIFRLFELSTAKKNEMRVLV